MNRSEALAKCVIEAVLPSSVAHFRPDQSDGSHDFDVRRVDGAVFPLEVTASTDQRYLETVAAIRNPARGGHFIDATACTKGWMVFPRRDARINALRASLDSMLAPIEAAGYTRFSLQDVDCEPIERLVMELRVEYGVLFEWKKPRQIGIMLPSMGTRVDPRNVTRAITLELRKPDNLRKLGGVDAAERHLSVHVTVESYPAWCALLDSNPPDGELQLPVEISDVWAAALDRGSAHCVVWHASPDWRRVGSVPVRRAVHAAEKE